jgi:hypothetical protein
MFLQFVVHAHAKSLPTTTSKANPKHPPGRAQRSGALSGAKPLSQTPNPFADYLKPRRSSMFQLNVAVLVATKFPEYPILKANTSALKMDLETTKNSSPTALV